MVYNEEDSTFQNVSAIYFTERELSKREPR